MKRRKPIKRQLQTRLGEHEVEQLVEAYSRLASVYKVGERFGIHRSTVAAILERHGVRRRFNVLSQEQVRMASTLYLAGHSLAKLGKDFGVAAKTMHNALRAAGVPMRPVGTNQWR